MKSLNQKMASGAMLMSLLRVCVRGVGLLSTVILARVLVPADFGIVAMATSIIAFLQLATAFSFDIPLIQKQDADRSYFDSAWTLNVLFYAALTVVLLFLAKPAATFYQDIRLGPVIWTLGIGFFVQGFENIGFVHFRKELNFRMDFVLMLSKKVAAFAVTIPLALLFRSYWALVAGMVFGNVFGVVLTYMLHPFRPRFSLRQSSELLGFSKWLVLNNIIGFLRNRSPDFIIGRLSGTSALGLFTVAYEVSTLPTTELVAPINRVVFPGYSKLAGNVEDLRRSYIDVLTVIAVVALPAGFGIAAVSNPLIAVFLGDKWLSAAPIVSLLAIHGGLNALLTNTGSVFNAIGKPQLITWIGGVNTLMLLVSSIILALNLGPYGIAIGYVCTTVLIAPIAFYNVCRETQLSFRTLCDAIWPPLLCTGAMYGAVRVTDIQLHLTETFGDMIALLLFVTCGALIYIGSMLTLWLLRGRPATVEQRVLRMLLAKLQGQRNAAPAIRPGK